MANLKRQIAEKQLLLKRTQRDCKFIHGKARINAQEVLITTLKTDIEVLGVKIRKES